MLPSFLITLREVIEASLIVATILGILVKFKQTSSIKTVWLATASAAVVSFGLLAVASLLGVQLQKVYTGKTEEMIEGILMMVSAVFITWAVFFLHTYFSRYKLKLLKKINTMTEKRQEKGLFILVFTAVFREGFEVVLFLSTIYFSSDPQHIFAGFSGGLVVGLLVSLALFTATVRLPVYVAFRATSILLILFAAGLLARGVHELSEVGLMPELGRITIAAIPHSTTFAGSMIKALFGLTQHMDIFSVFLWASYVCGMTWWVFLRNKRVVSHA